MTSHSYRSVLRWSGSTEEGYESYSREHEVLCPPAEAGLKVSSDPAFGGDAALVNPEQLLLAAASSCQLLSFLAVAARARVDVVLYSDEAEAVMPEDDKPVRITRIMLRPHVVARNTDEERVRHLLEVAHEHCFVANSLISEVVIEPRIEIL